MWLELNFCIAFELDVTYYFLTHMHFTIFHGFWILYKTYVSYLPWIIQNNRMRSPWFSPRGKPFQTAAGRFSPRGISPLWWRGKSRSKNFPVRDFLLWVNYPPAAKLALRDLVPTQHLFKTGPNKAHHAATEEDVVSYFHHLAQITSTISPLFPKFKSSPRREPITETQQEENFYFQG